MSMRYTKEENTRILIALLKRHGIRKVVASPGTMNINFVGSIQGDPFFEVYSAADERSAAYIACGMAAESGECVCLSCTGATASRNYIPGLTEAYYRKLPVVAITSTQPVSHVGHNMAQVIDRGEQLNDMVRYSGVLPTIRCEDDRWSCTIAVNRALIECRRHGGGPVHLNLEAVSQADFSVGKLPEVRKIEYRCAYDSADSFPEPKGKRIGVFVGSHSKMSDRLESAITRFCEKYDGVVVCDRTSNYFGSYRVVPGIALKQDAYATPLNDFDVLVHIGEVSGSQYHMRAREVWRVSEDGEIRDTFRRLTCVFEMSEEFFFEAYSAGDGAPRSAHLAEWQAEIRRLGDGMPELPFSNMWIAKTMSELLPEGCVIHMGILNTLRSWDYFDSDRPTPGYANTGGFGIDGGLSSLVGGALADPRTLHFGFLGDLAFFYDMNVLGNRHVPSNVRIMLINNGRGAEFRKYNHPASRFGEDADLYMAAAGHYGNKSPQLVRHYAEDLGYTYMCASSKEEFLSRTEEFVSADMDSPVLFEAFTDWENDDEAIRLMNSVKEETSKSAKAFAKSLLGKQGVDFVKKMIR